MGIFRVGWWLLFPLVCQTLPSDVAERERELARVDQKRDVLSEEEEVHAIQHGKSQDEGSVCGVRAGISWGNLETHGLLREYETGFLDSIKQELWDHQALFGVCPGDTHSANMVAMKELARFLTEPQGKQFVFLHLQKVEWESGTSMQFHGTVQGHVSPLLQHLYLLLAVFYPDTHIPTPGSKVIMSGGAVPQGQVVCLSLESRYLVVRLNGTVRTIEPGDLKLHASFHMEHYSNGLALSTAEAVRHLFGVDKKCSTKITPVLIMVVGHSVQTGSYPTILQPDQNKSASSDDLQTTVTYKKKDGFLETLSHFSTLLMTSHAKASSTVHLPLDPNDESAGDLRPQLLNVTELEALEWLIESQEPLVFLFLPGSKNLLANRIQRSLNRTLLQRITGKMQEVLEDMKEVFSTPDNVQVLKKLISSCHGHVNVSFLPVEEEKSLQLEEKQHRKLHSLMLLKTLQTIHAYWQDRKKLSRQNREAGLKPHCRLQELTINLKPYPEYKDIHFPEEININNCVGPCRFPQTTQSDYQAHVILLIQLQERRQSGLDRPPCCVPVRYQEQWLMVAHENGIKLHLYPNMVAKECGCR